jgi:hypothetical protein
MDKERREMCRSCSQVTKGTAMKAHNPLAERRHREDRRDTAKGTGDLHQRIERKVAAIEAERRGTERRHTDVIGRGEGMPLDESHEAASWQHEIVSERLRMLSHYGIT